MNINENSLKLKLQISCLLRARSSLTFRQLWSVDSFWNTYMTWQEHTVNWLHCSCSFSFPSAQNSLFMFYLIYFCPYFIVHCSFLFLSVLCISFNLPFGCTHITSSFNLIVSFTFHPVPSLQIKDLQVSLDVLILQRHSLLEAELWWFYYSFSLYIKHQTRNTTHSM